MRSSRFVRVAALALMLAVARGSAVSAQQGEAAPDASPQGAQQRLIEMFLDHATLELNLTEEQRGGLEDVLRETMDRRAELSRNQVRLRREITDALSDPATSAAEFQRLADASLALKAREVELLEWQQARLLDVLTPRQSLRFQIMQERLAQRVAEMRRRRADPRQQPPR